MINKNLGNMPQNQIPLLLWNSTTEKAVEESVEQTFKYNYQNQIVEYDCAMIGTKSLKSFTTKPKGTTDRKNEIDDSKPKK